MTDGFRCFWILGVVTACTGPKNGPDSGPSGNGSPDAPGPMVDSGDTGDSLGTLSRLPTETCVDPDSRGEGGFDAVTLGPGWDADHVGDAVHQYAGGGIIASDFDDDGFVDLLLSHAGSTELWMSDGTGAWGEVSGAALPDHVGVATGGCAGDLDGDDDIDVVLLSLRAPNRVLYNDGTGVFTDGFSTLGPGEAGEESALENDSVGCTMADVDDDGDLDVLVANHFEGPHIASALLSGSFSPAHLNTLHLNDGEGLLDDGGESGRLPGNFRNGYSFLIGVLDTNADGADELMVVNDFGAQYRPNGVVQRVDDEWQTVEDARGLDVALYGMGLALGDLNGDGVEDMAITSWGEIALLESDPGGWARTGPARGLTVDTTRPVGWGIDFVDVDNDTDLDLPASFGALVMPGVVSTALEETIGLTNGLNQPDALWIQGSSGRFSEESASHGVADAGIGRGLISVDLNRDGWMDLVKRQLDEPDLALLNRCGHAGSLGVELRSPGPNTRGIGAHVTIEIDGAVQTRRIRAGGTSHASSGPPEVHFGLGEADTVDVLTVRWPDGGESRFTDVAAGRVRVQP